MHTFIVCTIPILSKLTSLQQAPSATTDITTFDQSYKIYFIHLYQYFFEAVTWESLIKHPKTPGVI